ncbi:MAG: metallophosphoesterase [Muribaculaceae bacterium]|nr:metallophosphoesterase [Muribaculaceae bacterium]
MIILILLNAAVDFYIFKVLKQRVKYKFVSKLHLWLSIAFTIAVIVVISLPRRSGSDASLLAVMWSLFAYMSVYVSKYILIVFDGIASIPHFWFKHRWKIVSMCGLALSFITFGFMWWGALINRYDINVNEVDVEILNLPESFEGYRVAQISDLHLGTYQKDTLFISTLVDSINNLDVDVVVFTGDIVNRTTNELAPFITTLSRIEARDGVYSILGNHDYGDYSDWASDEDKKANNDLMRDYQREMGWNLLLNETRYLKRGNDSIAVIGVENVGDPPFKNYGSLKDAYPVLNDSTVKILLSHNPAHWEREISNHNERNIALTLSGHTHAMQISLLGISPASLRYKYWSGLYADDSNRQKLYVNVGVGTVAMPMRIGANPEITILKLKRQ